MSLAIPPRSLPADFGMRIAEMCRVAVERGHSDVGYLLELASQMAAQRENAAALGPAHWHGGEEAIAASPLAE